VQTGGIEMIEGAKSEVAWHTVDVSDIVMEKAVEEVSG
jgi:hypothetical protein